ncbi:hypothetical protein [Ralstonia pickettii]|uniref:hypothetical protein n=1 Tax=Ralstonia pickettii TaxID=329 RepID=UPI0015FC9A46|nr:hypothetical protein [Ralstonia pickettii]MBX3778936.1 hypothetical protein [Ralstonia pickettii]MBX3831177.1 hypothetical protein [Ralstonia pickettii]MBX3849970.1 hypothetical protein [Ralstonia pickettii]MBX3916187.1 hypothetical protein [Ralstonia pickettii]
MGKGISKRDAGVCVGPYAADMRMVTCHDVDAHIDGLAFRQWLLAPNHAHTTARNDFAEVIELIGLLNDASSMSLE